MLAGTSNPGAPTPTPSPQSSPQATTYVFAASGTFPNTGVSVFSLDGQGNIQAVGPMMPLAEVIQVSATGNGLAVLSSSGISLYAVQPGGSLSFRNTQPVTDQAMAGDSRFVYAAGTDGIYGFDTQGGTLAPLPGNPTPYPPFPGCDPSICSGSGLAVATNRLFVGYEIGGLRLSHIIGSYARSANGALNYLSQNGGGDGAGVTATSDGRFAFTIDGGINAIDWVTVGPDGSFSLFEQLSSGIRDGFATQLAVSPDGKFLFAVCVAQGHFSGSAISVYQLDSSRGTVNEVPGSPFATGSNGADAMALDPTGRYLIVADGDISSVPMASNDIVVMAFDPSTGALTRTSSVKAPDAMFSIAVGKF